MLDVVFTIRRADLKRAIRQLEANRAPTQKADLVYVLVSEYGATFRATGTEAEYPVNGLSPGVAQLPITVLDRILDMRSSPELELRITDGAICCGKAAVRHKSVSLGKIPETRITVPINTSPFELVVIGHLLGEAAVTEQGLQSQVEKATHEMRLAISRAASSLATFGVTQSDIELLVEKAIKDAEPGIRRGLYE
jgi:hypothetical protein